MRKVIVGASAVALGASAVFALGAAAGQPGGPGAQKSPLTPVAGDADDCLSGSGGSSGFAILNAPGQPDVVDNVLGEVSLKRGAPNATYQVDLANVMGGSAACMLVATLTTNGVGNGNAHFDTSGMTGTYFVVLRLGMMGPEVYASAPVALR